VWPTPGLGLSVVPRLSLARIRWTERATLGRSSLAFGFFILRFKQGIVYRIFIDIVLVVQILLKSTSWPRSASYGWSDEGGRHGGR